MKTLEAVRFDAYTATAVGITPMAALDFFKLSGLSLHQGKGFHTFKERVTVKDYAGDEVGSVSFGGRQADRVMIEVKGEPTPIVVDAIRSATPHRCTRVDACADIERPGAWDELLSLVMAVKEKHDLYGERRGDWSKPEMGRTQYLGANSSAIRARLYEKGRQPEYRHLSRWDLCRLEIQVRPAKDAKDVYSALTPMQVWGASKWTRQLAADVLEQRLDAFPPGTVRRDSSRDRALKFMCGQYGPSLISLADDLGGWAELGLTLREMVAEQRRVLESIKRGPGQ